MTKIGFRAPDGISLAAHAVGPEEGAPVLLLGGIGQTRHSWRRTAERIAASGRRAILLDLRGHGESGWSADGGYTLPRLAADITAVIAALGRPAVLVGASLGGKVCLAAAGHEGPAVASALVMIDTVPRTNVAGASEVVSAIRPPPAGFNSPDDAAAELARARGQPLRTGAGEAMRRNMRVDVAGRWHWHWDPALLDRDQGMRVEDALPYLEGAAARLRVPTLVARGALSKVTDDAGVAAFRALVPHARVETVANAGHMLVGDQNDAFAAVLVRFLDDAVQP
ncbi:alpha/beta fold hydrolase [uncultured Sphingomonas sp.]|uniref:alpha/beta fold hydrolase n=1 Tax=uncultured Sphingomonas sp. TaxID=158754 RepID=UPI0035CBA8C8